MSESKPACEVYNHLAILTGVQALIEQLAQDKEIEGSKYGHALEAVAKLVEGEVRFFGSLAEEVTKGDANA